MRIGELAKRAGCQAETVRYYEREGLLPDPARTDGNYRSYNAEHLARLTFIRNCRALEMSLAEIRALLAIKDGAGRDCGEVGTVLAAHIGHVAERIGRLSALKTQLEALHEQCGGAEAVECCGILRELAEAAPGPDASGGKEGCCPSLTSTSPPGGILPPARPCPEDGSREGDCPFPAPVSGKRSSGLSCPVAKGGVCGRKGQGG
jgi:Cd(II)/Pb(II)-responsive transcriptional regulator